MDLQKFILYWYLIPLLLEAVEASECYFFENWLIKLNWPNLLNTLGTMIQDNYQSFYLSEPFTLARFNMRHPVEFFNYLASFTLLTRLFIKTKGFRKFQMVILINSVWDWEPWFNANPVKLVLFPIKQDYSFFFRKIMRLRVSI